MNIKIKIKTYLAQTNHLQKIDKKKKKFKIIKIIMKKKGNFNI